MTVYYHTILFSDLRIGEFNRRRSNGAAVNGVFGRLLVGGYGYDFNYTRIFKLT